MTPFVIVDTPFGLYGFTLSKSIRVSPETNQTVCHQRDSKIWQEPGNFTVEQSLSLIPLVITRAGHRGSYPECEGEAVLHRSRLNSELVKYAIVVMVDTITRLESLHCMASAFKSSFTIALVFLELDI